MKGITWSRDSHGLFDYESRHLTKNTMKTSNQAQLIRKLNDIQLNSLADVGSNFSQALAEADTKPLLNIIGDNGKFLFAFRSVY